MAQALHAYLVRYPDFTADTVLMDAATAANVVKEIDSEETHIVLLSQVPNFRLNQSILFTQEV